MAPATITSDWALAERRKQNTVLCVVAIACLVAAFFPHSQRRLFTFPEEGGVMEAITAPIQTRLRAGIFDPAFGWGGVGGPEDRTGPRAAPEPSTSREEMVLPAFEEAPDSPLFGDPWRDALWQDDPLRLDPGMLPGLTPMDGSENPGRGPFTVGYDRPVVFGGVPEPTTWAMMIGGIGAIAWRMRAVRRQARRRRAHARWRHSLLPRAARHDVRDCSPDPSRPA